MATEPETERIPRVPRPRRAVSESIPREYSHSVARGLDFLIDQMHGKHGDNRQIHPSQGARELFPTGVQKLAHHVLGDGGVEMVLALPWPRQQSFCQLANDILWFRHPLVCSKVIFFLVNVPNESP
jgi:hypothetical protein